MNKILSILLIFLVFITAGTAKEVIKTERVWSEYQIGVGDYTLEYGDKLYRLNYSDGTTDYKYEWSETPAMAFIASLQPVVNVPEGGGSGYITAAYSLRGVSCRMATEGYAIHTLRAYYNSALIGEHAIQVPCSTSSITTSDAIRIDKTLLSNAIDLNKYGEYTITIKERMAFGNSDIQGDTGTITLIVGTKASQTPQATPSATSTASPTETTATTPPPAATGTATVTTETPTQTATTTTECIDGQPPVNGECSSRKLPGFEALFAIAGLLIVAFLIWRQKDEE